MRLLRFILRVKIVFETQMLHAAATTPHELQGLYPDFDMPFNIFRGHRLIRGNSVKSRCRSATGSPTPAEQISSATDILCSVNTACVRSLLLLQAWVVVGVLIVKAERANRRDLCDIFPGLRPMEVPGFARQNDDAARRISLHLVAVELLA